MMMIMTDFKNQRRMAAGIMKVGINRVWIDPSAGKELNDAITKNDVRKFIHLGKIVARPIKGTSTARAKIIKAQKKKGRMQGHGSRSGTKNARAPAKIAWMVKIRALRRELKRMKDGKEINRNQYAKLYRQAGGGMFRNKEHLKLAVQKMKE